MALTLLEAIQAGALAEAIGLVPWVPSYYDLATRLRRDYPGLGIGVSRQLALLAQREVSAARESAALPPGEPMPADDVPVNPTVPAGVWQADVAVIVEDPDGHLDRIRITIDVPADFSGTQLHDAVQEAWDRGITGSPPLTPGSVKIGYRLISVDRGG